MVIPFLQIIFDMVKPPTDKPELSWNLKELMGYFNYQFAEYVAIHGKASGLLIVCISVVVMFFIKNIFRYLALYFLAPLRTGVVRELRQGVFDKILQLPLSYFSETRKGDIIARMSTDVKEVETSIMNTLESTFRDPVTMLCFFIAMLLISVELTVFVFILRRMSLNSVYRVFLVIISFISFPLLTAVDYTENPAFQTFYLVGFYLFWELMKNNESSIQKFILTGIFFGIAFALRLEIIMTFSFLCLVYFFYYKQIHPRQTR